MTRQYATTVGQQALQRAKDADDRIWSIQGHSARYLRVRDRAVAEALGAGVCAEQVADELGVLIGDVERMLAADASPPMASRSPEREADH